MSGDSWLARENAQKRSERALQIAQERLKRDGHTFPIYDPAKPPNEAYDEIEAFRNREAQYYQQALQELSNGVTESLPPIQQVIKQKPFTKPWGDRNWYD